MSTSLVCRLCGQPLRTTFLDLGTSPLSNAFVRPEAAYRMEPFYPLRAYVCEGCFLVQVPAFERADAIFGEEYPYFSSYSDSWLRHCDVFARQMTRRLDLGPKSLVVELASNDGALLGFFKKAGVGVLGVEPSRSVARAAEERGIPTETRFFGVAAAEDLARRGRSADLLVANNVLAHVPDLHDFVGGMKVLMARGGVLTIEFPHLANLISEVQFDTIYQEHYSYFTLATARRALAGHALEVFDVEELPTHGGSLRLYARHAENATPPVASSVHALLERERIQGLDRIDTYTRMRERVDAVKHDLLEFLIRAKREGKRVVGYGAPAKGNTLLNYCGIREDLLEFTVDKNPHKQGLLLPGTRIPVHDPSRIEAVRPDYVLILPWNIRDEVMEQLDRIRAWGARFVVAIPRLQVLP
jgi:SAM-dependent methyltransferase